MRRDALIVASIAIVLGLLAYSVWLTVRTTGTYIQEHGLKSVVSEIWNGGGAKR